jgi:fused signal recognition particle receptor
MHRPRLRVAPDAETLRRRDFARGLGVDESGRREPLRARGQQRRPWVGVERRIQKNDIERPRLMGEKFGRPGGVHLDFPHAEREGGRFERANQRRVAVDGHGKRCAPRRRLERKRAAPCVEVKRAPPAQFLAEPVEQRFPDAIGRRSEPWGSGKPHDAAPVPSPDDANALGVRRTQRRSRGPVHDGPVELQFCPRTSIARALAMFDLFKPKAPVASAEAPSWTERLKSGLSVSRGKLSGALSGVLAQRALDDAALHDLESALLMADVGVAATAHLLDDMKARYRRSGGGADPRAILRASLNALLEPLEAPLLVSDARPFVIMLAGVNGAGKTTSIGKLAKWFQQQGLAVLLAAGDTFRAAAREQLVVWGERNGVAVIQQQGGDAAAVMFDAINAARARGIHVVLADTAGRLATQAHLMDELAKIKRVIAKTQPGAPHEVLLVVDANTGQNAVAQVAAFDRAVGLTGLILTKLDGSAKGGVVAAIAEQHPVPLKFIGVGEGADDLRPFVVSEFVDALLPDAG